MAIKNNAFNNLSMTFMAIFATGIIAFSIWGSSALFTKYYYEKDCISYAEHNNLEFTVLKYKQRIFKPLAAFFKENPDSIDEIEVPIKEVLRAESGTLMYWLHLPIMIIIFLISAFLWYVIVFKTYKGLQKRDKRRFKRQ